MFVDLIGDNFNFILIIVIILISLVHFLTKMSASEDVKDRIQKVRNFEKFSKSQENGDISLDNTVKSQKILDANFISSLRARLQGTIDGYKLRLEQAGWSSENGFLIYVISNVSGFIIGTSLF